MGKGDGVIMFKSVISAPERKSLYLLKNKLERFEKKQIKSAQQSKEMDSYCAGVRR